MVSFIAKPARQTNKLAVQVVQLEQIINLCAPKLRDSTRLQFESVISKFVLQTWRLVTMFRTKYCKANDDSLLAELTVKANKINTSAF